MFTAEDDSSSPEITGREEDFLQAENAKFVRSIAPTLAYLTVVTVAGLVGNFLVFTVYRVRFKDGVTRTYIMALCVCNLLGDTLAVPAEFIRLCFRYTFVTAVPCRVIVAIQNFLVPLSAFLLVAVAADRYRRVCRPAMGNAASSSKRAWRFVLLCVALAFIYTVPCTVIHGPKSVSFTNGTNVTGVMCYEKDDAFPSLFAKVFDIVAVAMTAISITVMLGYYALISRHLCLHRHRHHGHTLPAGGHRRKENETQAGDRYVETELSRTVHGHPETVTTIAETEQQSSEGHGTIARQKQNDVPAIIEESSYKGSENQASANGPAKRGSVWSKVMKEFRSGLARTIMSAQTDNNSSAVHSVNEDNMECGDGESEPPNENDQDSKDGKKHPVASFFSRLLTVPDDQDRADCSDTDSVMADFNNDINNGAQRLSYKRARTAQASPALSREQSQSELATAVSTMERTVQGRPSVHCCACCRRVLHVCWTASCLRPRPCRCSRQTDGRRVPRRPTGACTRGGQTKIPRRTTLLLFVLTALYTLTYLPRDVMILTGHGKHLSLRSVEHDGWYFNFKHILFRSWAINGAISPLVYGFCSRQFRQECWRLFARRQ